MKKPGNDPGSLQISTSWLLDRESNKPVMNTGTYMMRIHSTAWHFLHLNSFLCCFQKIKTLSSFSLPVYAHIWSQHACDALQLEYVDLSPVVFNIRFSFNSLMLTLMVFLLSHFKPPLNVRFAYASTEFCCSGHLLIRWSMKGWQPIRNLFIRITLKYLITLEIIYLAEFFGNINGPRTARAADDHISHHLLL